MEKAWIIRSMGNRTKAQTKSDEMTIASVWLFLEDILMPPIKVPRSGMIRSEKRAGNGFNRTETKDKVRAVCRLSTIRNIMTTPYKTKVNMPPSFKAVSASCIPGGKVSVRRVATRM